MSWNIIIFWLTAQIGLSSGKPTTSTVKKPLIKEVQNKKPTSRPNTKSQNNTKKRRERLTVICKNRPRFGRFCVGRVIGPLVRDEIVRCPLCGKPVKVRRLLRPWPSWNFDSDLRPHSKKRYRQVHRLWTCRHCGYSSYWKDFFKPFEKKRVLEALKPLRKTWRDYNSIPPEYRFQTAAAVYWARRKDAKFFAQFFLRALWSMREENRPKQLSIFRSRAISAIKIALQKNLFSQSERPKYLFLLGELYRQEKKFSKAIFYLEKALFALKSLKNSPKSKIKELKSYIEQVRERALKGESAPFVLK